MWSEILKKSRNCYGANFGGHTYLHACTHTYMHVIFPEQPHDSPRHARPKLNMLAKYIRTYIHTNILQIRGIHASSIFFFFKPRLLYMYTYYVYIYIYIHTHTDTQMTLVHQACTSIIITVMKGAPPSLSPSVYLSISIFLFLSPSLFRTTHKRDTHIHTFMPA